LDPDDYFVEHGEPKDRLDDFASIIRTGLGAFAPMLDIGRGRGESLAAAKKLGWEARAAEPSAEFAEEGARELGVAIDVGTVEGRYPDASFGLVLLSALSSTSTTPSSCWLKLGGSLRGVASSTSTCRTSARSCTGAPERRSG